MARVTVEDCIGEGRTNNRFELVLLAAQRTKNIHAGLPITVPAANDKNPVIALREIAAGNIKIDELRSRFIASLHPSSNINFVEEDLEANQTILETTEFIREEQDFALTEEQMLIDQDFSFGDDHISYEDKN